MKKLLIILMPILLVAQTNDARLRLIRANLLENITRNGQSVQILEGKVKFQKKEMILFTDMAEFYKQQDLTHLIGNVKMIRPGEILTCDTLVFHNNDDRIEARGRVQFEQEQQTVESREFIYWTKLDSGIARGDVIMTQENRQLTAAEFRTVEGPGIRGASFYAYGAVVVDEGERKIAADLMHYDDIQSIMTLSGDAKVAEVERQLMGATIRLVYDGEQLKKGYVKGGAEVISRLDARLTENENSWRSFTDILTSQEMEATFADDRMESLELQNMASSVYHVVEDSLLKGVNYASGDTIIIGLDTARTLVRLTIKGGARGRFEPEINNAQVDTVVLYRAEFIDYDIPGKVTFMERAARVDYHDNGLSAGSLTLTWNNNLLRAENAFDEAPSLLQRGSDPMIGELMEFDLIEEKGRVFRGRTKLDNGYYHGKVVHRHPGNIYYVKTSLFTTCELDNPHFYFESNKMKMIQGDKVVARPVVLYLVDVPLLALPYAVFPNKGGGRRSGWIMPGYGESSRDGQYLKGLGYFWAINDYMDETTTMNLFDRKGFQFHHRFRYTARYKYRGNVRASQFTTVLDKNLANQSPENIATKWFVEWNHSQTIDPTQHLNVSAKYISDPQTLRNFAIRRAERLKQQMLSSASYSKNWQNLTLALAVRETYDLNAATRLLVPPVSLGQKIEERTRTLPNISLSKKQQALIESKANARERWYNKVYWSANSNINNRQNIYWEADSSADSLAWQSKQITLNRFFIKNSYRINASQKVFKYFAVNLAANISQGIVPDQRRARLDSTGVFETDSTSGRVLYDEIDETAIRHTGNMSLSAQTNIYGLIPVRIGKYRAIRHVIKPSITFSYSPDFSKKILGNDLGYFQKDARGQLFDRFAGSALGGTPTRESKSMSFSLGNLFQAKEEVDGVENKVDLLNWTMSGGYNFTADSLGLSSIRSSFRSPLLKNLHLDISMVHDFYRWDETSRRRVNELLKFPRLAQMSASSSLKLSGTRLGAEKENQEAVVIPDSLLEAEREAEREAEDSGFRDRLAKPVIASGNLWEATLRLRYNLTTTLDPDRREIFRLDGDIKASLGPGWKIGYSMRLDMLNQELISHDLRLYRQLHCWEFAFSWTPSGPGQSFLLNISVMNNDLKDIKFESRGGRRSRYAL